MNTASCLVELKLLKFIIKDHGMKKKLKFCEILLILYNI